MITLCPTLPEVGRDIAVMKHPWKAGRGKFLRIRPPLALRVTYRLAVYSVRDYVDSAESGWKLGSADPAGNFNRQTMLGISTDNFGDGLVMSERSSNNIPTDNFDRFAGAGSTKSTVSGIPQAPFPR